MTLPEAISGSTEPRSSPRPCDASSISNDAASCATSSSSAMHMCRVCEKKIIGSPSVCAKCRYRFHPKCSDHDNNIPGTKWRCNGCLTRSASRPGGSTAVKYVSRRPSTASSRDSRDQPLRRVANPHTPNSVVARKSVNRQDAPNSRSHLRALTPLDRSSRSPSLTYASSIVAAAENAVKEAPAAPHASSKFLHADIGGEQKLFADVRERPSRSSSQPKALGDADGRNHGHDDADFMELPDGRDWGTSQTSRLSIEASRMQGLIERAILRSAKQKLTADIITTWIRKHVADIAKRPFSKTYETILDLLRINHADLKKPICRTETPVEHQGETLLWWAIRPEHLESCRAKHLRAEDEERVYPDSPILVAHKRKIDQTSLATDSIKSEKQVRTHRISIDLTIDDSSFDGDPGRSLAHMSHIRKSPEVCAPTELPVLKSSSKAEQRDAKISPQPTGPVPRPHPEALRSSTGFGNSILSRATTKVTSNKPQNRGSTECVASETNGSPSKTQPASSAVMQSTTSVKEEASNIIARGPQQLVCNPFVSDSQASASSEHQLEAGGGSTAGGATVEAQDAASLPVIAQRLRDVDHDDNRGAHKPEVKLLNEDADSDNNELVPDALQLLKNVRGGSSTQAVPNETLQLHRGSDLGLRSPSPCRQDIDMDEKVPFSPASSSSGRITTKTRRSTESRCDTPHTQTSERLLLNMASEPLPSLGFARVMAVSSEPTLPKAAAVDNEDSAAALVDDEDPMAAAIREIRERHKRLNAMVTESIIKGEGPHSVPRHGPPRQQRRDVPLEEIKKRPTRKQLIRMGPDYNRRGEYIGGLAIQEVIDCLRRDAPPKPRTVITSSQEDDSLLPEQGPVTQDFDNMEDMLELPQNMQPMMAGNLLTFVDAGNMQGRSRRPKTNYYIGIEAKRR